MCVACLRHHFPPFYLLYPKLANAIDFFGTPRRGGATADGGGRHKGQSLSGEKQLSVSEAVRTLVGHIFRTGGAWRDGARTAMVVGQA